MNRSPMPAAHRVTARSRHQRSVLTALSLGAVFGLLPAPVRAAAPPPITCGSVITSSTHLSSDLSCTDTGITLRGNVTLDLRGHRISGTSGVGVTVTGSDLSSATIKGGTITGWTSGVAVPFDDIQVSRVTVSRMRFTNDETGIDNSITRVTLGDQTKAVGGMQQLQVSDSSFVHLRSGIGVPGNDTGQDSVVRSRFLHNDVGIAAGGGLLAVSSSYLSDNEVGVSCAYAACTVTANRLINNAQAVAAPNAGATLVSNQISDNAVGFSSSFDSLLTNNVFTDNRLAASFTQGGGGQLTRNRFLGNQQAIVVTEEWGELQLTRNLLLRNGDAVVAEIGGVRLQANAAFSNTGWGLDVPGARDLGGNRAHANGREPQCVGVVCRP